MKIVVTGGAGFIGSALIRHMIENTEWEVTNVDCLTYAGNLNSLVKESRSPRYKFLNINICDSERIGELFAGLRPDAVVHLAAESHVDRSIDGPGSFIETNIVGTYSLLSSALRYWDRLDNAGKHAFRFVHISTDEVFGSLKDHGHFNPESPHRPNSPYSASKAASDHLVRAWFSTYGLPTITTNCSNNYGPYQFPEKLIPLIIIRALAEQGLPVYGKGENIRDWLFVDDHVRALTSALLHGEPGEVYTIGGGSERRNIDVVNLLCGILDEKSPRSGNHPYRDLIEFVADRPGHDERYAVDFTKAQKSLGWQPSETLESGLRKTVDWYLGNRAWWEHILSGAYRADRLGLRQRAINPL